jgi:hypothetical protein
VTIKVAAVEVTPTATTTSWSPLGSEGINTSIVKSPDALVGHGYGSTKTVPNVRDSMLVKGGNPDPMMVTTCPGSADCGSTVMDAGIAEPIVIGVLAEVPPIATSTCVFPNPNWGIKI